MKRIALASSSLLALAGIALIGSGCGSDESPATTGAGVQQAERKAAGLDDKLVCPEQKSFTLDWKIVNKLDRKIFLRVSGVDCRGWSSSGNPGYLNGTELQPGWTLDVPMQESRSSMGIPSQGNFVMDIGRSHLGSTNTLPIPFTGLRYLRVDGGTSCQPTNFDDPNGGVVRVSVSCRSGTLTFEKG